MNEDVVISVRIMTPTDTPSLAACIRRCYGESYTKRVMYEPAALAAMVGTGVYNGVVATAGNDVVGHIGFDWPNPNATVVEAGTTVVDPNYRGSGLMKRLAQALRESVIAAGAVGFIHFPTTAHAVMQKASLSAGRHETGVMLAYLPPEARDLTIGGSGDDRLAVTVVYQPLADSPQREIFVPDRYANLIQGFAERLRLPRVASVTQAEPSGTTMIRQTPDLDRGLQRLTVEHIGEDLADVVRSAASTDSASLIHIDLAMNQPEIHFAVEQLRQSGFAFAAWMPGWATSDVLRLQLLKNPTDGELKPNLHSVDANNIAALIRNELHI
jgi:GNAT superfamily N-acetyltransferase